MAVLAPPCGSQPERAMRFPGHCAHRLCRDWCELVLDRVALLVAAGAHFFSPVRILRALSYRPPLVLMPPLSPGVSRTRPLWSLSTSLISSAISGFAVGVLDAPDVVEVRFLVGEVSEQEQRFVVHVAEAGLAERGEGCESVLDRVV